MDEFVEMKMKMEANTGFQEGILVIYCRNFLGIFSKIRRSTRNSSRIRAGQKDGS